MKLPILILLVAATTLTTTSDATIIHFQPPEKITAMGFIGIQNPILKVDINGDAVDDFEFSLLGATDGAKLLPLANNRIIIADSVFLEPLETGVSISSSLQSPLVWGTQPAVLSACAGGCLGRFDGQTAFIGMEFAIGGNTHYGWMQFEDIGGLSGGYILDWAYESSPGLGIQAGALEAGVIPEPSTASLLMLGICAALILRCRQLF